MMATKSATARASMERDVPEALRRLKLARAQRDRKQVDLCGKELDRLLDKMVKELGIGAES